VDAHTMIALVTLIALNVVIGGLEFDGIVRFMD
jgi:hypothetical protein